MIDLAEASGPALGPLATALTILTETSHELSITAQAATNRDDRAAFAIAISEMDKLVGQTAAILAAADVLARTGR